MYYDHNCVTIQAIGFPNGGTVQFYLLQMNKLVWAKFKQRSFSDIPSSIPHCVLVSP